MVSGGQTHERVVHSDSGSDEGREIAAVVVVGLGMWRCRPLPVRSFAKAGRSSECSPHSVHVTGRSRAQFLVLLEMTEGVVSQQDETPLV